MNRKNIFNTGAHILFCLLFVYWFSTHSFIRPYAIHNPYKEVVSALLVLLVTYLNYIILTPYFFKKSNYKNYITLSILLIGVFSAAELLLVKSNILRCFAYVESFDINRHLYNIFFLTFLRNIGFYLFFTVLKLYQQTKANALIGEKEILKSSGFIVLWPLRGKPIAVNIDFVSYFSHKKNITFIHNNLGKVTSIYSTLNNIQEYLGSYCLRINKENIITFTNIISYNEKEVAIKDGKAHTSKLLFFSKKGTEYILHTLRKNVPELEGKNAIYPNEKRNGTINEDEKRGVGTIKTDILEEIKQNPGINATKLHENLHKNTSIRTIKRRLKKLTDSGLIQFKGAKKTGGYYIV